MPRKNPLPAKEIEIGRRLQRGRVSLGSSRPQLASAVGVDASTIKRIELGRSPLRYSLAKRICTKLDLSQAWLAGLPAPTRSALLIDESLEMKIPEKALFSEAFSKFIEPEIPAATKDRLASFSDVRTVIYLPIGSPEPRRREWMLLTEVRAAMKGVPENLHREFWDMLSKSIDNFCEEHRIKRKLAGLWKPSYWKGIYATRLSDWNPETEDLDANIFDTPPTDFILADVKSEIPTWKQVVAALTKFANKDGGKAWLARELKTTRQNVDNWIRGARAPRADIALAVAEWVRTHGGWK